MQSRHACRSRTESHLGAGAVDEIQRVELGVRFLDAAGIRIDKDHINAVHTPNRLIDVQVGLPIESETLAALQCRPRDKEVGVVAMSRVLRDKLVTVGREWWVGGLRVEASRLSAGFIVGGTGLNLTGYWLVMSRNPLPPGVIHQLD